MLDRSKCPRKRRGIRITPIWNKISFSQNGYRERKKSRFHVFPYDIRKMKNENMQKKCIATDDDIGLSQDGESIGLSTAMGILSDPKKMWGKLAAGITVIPSIPERLMALTLLCSKVSSMTQWYTYGNPYGNPYCIIISPLISMKVATFVVYNGLYHPLKPSINRSYSGSKKGFRPASRRWHHSSAGRNREKRSTPGWGLGWWVLLGFFWAPKKISGWVLIITYLIELDHGFL